MDKTRICGLTGVWMLTGNLCSVLSDLDLHHVILEWSNFKSYCPNNINHHSLIFMIVNVLFWQYFIIGRDIQCKFIGSL